MEALTNGTLGLKENCIYLERGESLANYLLIWPPYYYFSNENGSIQIVDGEGKIVASIGDRVEMSGGEIHSLSMLDKSIQEQVPPQCPGPYWIIGEDFLTVNPRQIATASIISLNPLPTGRLDFNLINPEVAWAVTGQQAALRTTDGGKTWRDVTPMGRAVYSLNVLDETHAWTTFTSDPDPRNSDRNDLPSSRWRAERETFTVPFVMGDVHFLALKDGFAVASPMQCGAGTCWIELWQSKDGGETWEQLFITDPSGGTPDDRFPPGTVSIPSGQDFWFSDSDTIWEFGDYWIYPDLGKNILLKVSWDGGRTWQDQRATPPTGIPETAPSYVDHPVFLNQDEGYLAAYYTTRNNDGSIYQTWIAFYFTQDGGHTWVARPGILQLTQSYTGWQVVSAQDLFIRAGEHLFTSIDGAQTWQPISSNLNFGSDQNQALVGFDFVDPLNG